MNVNVVMVHQCYVHWVLANKIILAFVFHFDARLMSVGQSSCKQRCAASGAQTVMLLKPQSG